MDVAELKQQLKQQSSEKLKSSNRNIKIIAEGDSWFDYKIQKDIIDYLQIMGYAIHKHQNIADPGDTLENMVYGEAYKINKKTSSVSNKGDLDLQETLKAVKDHNPRFVLFSAGGNDIAGEEMINYLNHKRSGSPTNLK